MEKELYNMILKLNKLKKESFNIYIEEYEFIIKNNIKDINLIEHLLDDMLNSIYDYKSEQYYVNLCEYLKSINIESSNFYLKLLKEEY